MMKWIKKNKRSFVIIVILIFLIIFLCLVGYNLYLVKKFDNQVYNNTYVDRFDLTNYDFSHAEKKINICSEYLLSKKVTFKINGNSYTYTLKDLGFGVDSKKTIEQIEKYQDKLSFSDRLLIINKGIKKKFNVYYSVDEDKLSEFFAGVKVSVDKTAMDGHFDTSDGVKYVEGTDGFSFSIPMSIEIVKDYFLDSVGENISIDLVGDKVPANNNDSYASIDTMTSSFVTKFDTWVTARATNLRVALSYINGAIIEPGEVFSYYKYAGPYNKAGYVFYYEFVGNGVCQIATTTYNAALLGGLEIVKRYPHAKKSVYVAGGLDATVASYSSGWNVDMQWKNTYKYPIYIKAYAVGGEAHVEFWSNSNAKEGKTYTTESVWLGGRGYKTYLHTFKDGVEIDKSLIATTWYSED